MEKRTVKRKVIPQGVDDNRNKSTFAIVSAVVFILLIIFLALSIRQVPAGHVGVYTNGMNIGTQKDSGWLLKNPLSTMKTYRYNTQTIKETVIVTSIEDDGSGYNVPMDFQVVYNLDKKNMGDLIVNNPDYVDTKIIQRLRSKVRQIIAEESYSGIDINKEKSKIQTQVSDDLEEYLIEYHIIIEEVALRNIDLPNNIQQASRDREEAAIRILEAHNKYLEELEIVKKKEANAAADYKVALINANATEKRLIIEANGSAQAIAKIQSQFNLTDANLSSQVYLQYLFMSALSDPNTNVEFFIVPVGADGMPVILDLSKYSGNDDTST